MELPLSRLSSKRLTAAEVPTTVYETARARWRNVTLHRHSQFKLRPKTHTATQPLAFARGGQNTSMFCVTATRHHCFFRKLLGTSPSLRVVCNGPRGVTVSTLDSESSDRGSNPREASHQVLTFFGNLLENQILNWKHNSCQILHYRVTRRHNTMPGNA